MLSGWKQNFSRILILFFSPHAFSPEIPPVHSCMFQLWVLLVMACGTPPQCGLMRGAMSAPMIQTSETLGCRSGVRELNHSATGPAPRFVISYFSFSSSKPPSTQLCILVVGPSSCSMWDTASVWPDEWCRVCTQDVNQRNPGPRKQSTRTSPLGHRAGPSKCFLYNFTTSSTFLLYSC